VRRLARWLDHDRIAVHSRCGPLMQHAVSGWGNALLDLALETSSLWHTSCMVRLSLVYRGSAVPLVWKVLAPPRSRVASDSSHDARAKVAERLP